MASGIGGQANSMKDEAVRFVVEDLVPALGKHVDQETVRQLMDRSKSRQK